MIKRDINNLKSSWESWKEQNKKGIPEVSEHNAKIILSFLSDMELGVNISKTSSKGWRGGTHAGPATAPCAATGPGSRGRA